MKTQKFTSKDGTEGLSHSLEAGDEVIAKFESVGTRENLVVKDGKPLKINNHFLGVEHNGDEITIKVTDGQKKILDKESDLTDKVIIATSYKNEFGDQVGVKVKKD